MCFTNMSNKLEKQNKIKKFNYIEFNNVIIKILEF